MGVPVKLVLLATSVGHQGCSPALVNVGDAPIIGHWLKSLKTCLRLLPPHDKVYIVTSPATHEHFLQLINTPQSPLWGFPSANLLQYPEHTGAPAPVNELQFALEEVPCLTGSFVAVASLDYFLGINLDLQRIIEHTVIRGKDTVAYAVLPPGHALDGHTTVTLTGPDVNPKVASIDLQPVGEADGVSTAAMAPLAVLHPSTLPMVADVSVELAQQPGAHQLGVLMSKVSAHRPVYGLQLDMFLECVSEYGQAYASAFVNFYWKEVDAKASRGPAAEALEHVTLHAQETGTISVGDRTVEQLMKASSPAKQALLKFDVNADQYIAADIEAKKGHALDSRFGLRELPSHMADTTLRRHNPKKQHPVYETTNNGYGKRAPSEMDLPSGWAGSSGHFTRTFAGPYKARGLKTTITTSKVHHLLDDF